MAQVASSGCPDGLTVDRDDRLLFASAAGVWRIDPTGRLQRLAGRATPGLCDGAATPGCLSPIEITVAPDGDVLVLDGPAGFGTRVHRIDKAWAQIQEDIAGRHLNLVPLGAEVLTRADRILETCHPDVAVRSLEAIHVASAEQCQSWPLCSNDVRVREAARRLASPLSPLPSDPAAA